MQTGRVDGTKSRFATKTRQQADNVGKFKQTRDSAKEHVPYLCSPFFPGTVTFYCWKVGNREREAWWRGGRPLFEGNSPPTPRAPTKGGTHEDDIYAQFKFSSCLYFLWGL